ncbi:MAG: DMT family transporter [Gammaproteobacteria bacterium]
MMFAWSLVLGAIVAEVTAAVMLRSSDGFSRPLPSAAALGAFAAAFYLVSVALVDLPVSTVYPVWAGGGTAGVALVGVLLLKEKAHLLKGAGVACVVAGIVMLNLASSGA